MNLAIQSLSCMSPGDYESCSDYMDRVTPTTTFNTFPTTSAASAGKDARSGGLVRSAAVAVDVDQDAGVGGAVRAGKGDEVRRRLAAGAARHAKLRARQVELGAAGRRGRVQRHVLDAEQVLPVGEARRDGEADLGLALGRPGVLAPRDLDVVLVHLEPHRPRAVPVGDVGARWRFRHVRRQRALVVDAGRDGPRNGRAGLEGLRRRALAALG